MAKRSPYKRTDRLNRRIREVLAVALHSETREEQLRQVVVTDVEITRDLAHATIYYYPMEEASTASELDQAFGRAAGFLRGRVGQEVRMRRVPELHFALDQGIERGRRVDSILAELDLADEDTGPSGPE